jgi:hypothetical protein
MLSSTDFVGVIPGVNGITPDPFEGPRLKIARADKHIANFRACHDTLGQDLIRMRPYQDGDTGWLRTSFELAHCPAIFGSLPPTPSTTSDPLSIRLSVAAP